MNKVNYQKLLDEKIEEFTKEGRVPALFLHACCAPCSSYTLEYLSKYFNITIYFYNPNIDTKEEYETRIQELGRLIEEMPLEHEVKLVSGAYEPEKFYEIAKGKEDLPEGGARCYRCYELRMEEAARAAKEYGADYYTTTLSISPHKNADWLNSLGERFGEKYDIPYLYSDFKKKGGYHRSVQLSVFIQKKKQKEEMKVGQIDDLPFVYLHLDENIRNETKCNNSHC